jgi:hypothetical protein
MSRNPPEEFSSPDLEHEKNMNADEQILINNIDSAPTVVKSHRDGIGIVITQSTNRVMLDGAELHQLLQVIDRPPTVTSPSKARIQSYGPMHNHPSSD